MYNLGNLVLSFAMVISALWIVHKFLDAFLEKKQRNFWGIGAWILFAALQIIIEYYRGTASIWKFEFNIMLVCLISICNYQWEGIRNMLFVLLFFVMWALIEMIVFFGLQKIFVDERQVVTIGVVISKILMIVCVYLFSIYSKRKENEIIPTRYYIALLFVPVGSIYIAHIMFNTDGEYNSFSTMVVFSILLFLNIVIFELYDKIMESFLLEREKAIYSQQLEMLSKNTEEQKKMMEVFYREKHNWMNELIVLKNSLGSSDENMVSEEIDRIIHICNAVDKISDSGNSIIDAVLNAKYSMAKELGIDFKVKVFVPEELPINQYELGIALGNAVDNAIDAVKRCKTHKKMIDVSIGIKKEMLVITVKNPYEHALLMDKKGNLLSTKDKSDRHGYGLSSIRKIAEKYGGEVIWDVKDEKFSVVIFMNLQEF